MQRRDNNRILEKKFLSPRFTIHHAVSRPTSLSVMIRIEIYAFCVYTFPRHLFTVRFVDRLSARARVSNIQLGRNRKYIGRANLSPFLLSFIVYFFLFLINDGNPHRSVFRFSSVDPRSVFHAVRE